MQPQIETRRMYYQYLGILALDRSVTGQMRVTDPPGASFVNF